MPETATVSEALVAAATDRPDALAYSTDGEGITAGALLAEARVLAGCLARHLDRTDRCAVILPTGLDFIRTMYAAHFAGAVPAAINPNLPAEAVWRRLHFIRARVAVCDAAAVQRLRREAPPDDGCRLMTMDELLRDRAEAPAITMPDPRDPAFLQFTSGTTGESRAAIVSHRSLMASLRATSDRLGLSPADVLATWVPLHHDLGLVRYLFGAIVAGCASHLIRGSLLNLQKWLDLVTRVRATITGGPDSAYRLAARTVDPATVDLRSLRFAGNGGEAVRLTTIAQFEERFERPGVVRPAYGLAEATLTVTSTAPGEALRVDDTGTVSCGRPIDGIDLRIVGEGGRAVAPGLPGELLLRGAPIFDGYFGDEAATRLALGDGWLHTGDLASVDAQGYLFLKGRSRALIKRGGATIAPREIEDAVDRLAAVRGSAAVGVPSESDAGSEDLVIVAEVDAAVVSSPDRTHTALADIDAAVRRAMGWKPARIVLAVDGAIPRNAGKVSYHELRQMVLDGTIHDHVRGAPR